MGLRSEIVEQPDAAMRLLGARATVSRAARVIAGRDIEYVVIAARGSSDHAAIYAQYLFATRHRLAVALALPSATSLYGVTPNFRRALVVGISQSGQSPDIVGVVAEARSQGALTLAISNDRSSDLVAAAELSIDLEAGTERSVGASKTYTAELLALALLSADLAGNRADDEAALASVPELMSAALAEESTAARLAQEDMSMSRCMVLGRGFHYATAREWGLKLKELALVLADPYSAADFEHGPVALVEPGFPILAVLARGPAYAAMVGATVRLRERHGASMLALTDDAELGRILGRHLPFPSGAPEWLVPLVSIVPGQLYAYHLALAKGLDPDRPRSLQKVTLTR